MNRRSFIAWISSLCVVLPWKPTQIPIAQAFERESVVDHPAGRWYVLTSRHRPGEVIEIKTIGSYSDAAQCIIPALTPGFLRVYQSFHHDICSKAVNFVIIDREIPS